MSQTNLSTWVSIILGGGGLIGVSTLLFNLFKQVTDAKDADIRRLENRIASLEKDHVRSIDSLERQHKREINSLQRELENKKQELEKIGDFRRLIEEAVDDLERKGITAETNASLRKIESYLTSIQSNQEPLNSMKTAARWVEYRKEEWLRQAVEVAIEKYPDLIPKSQIASFEEDVANYLQWLYDSLFYGFFCRLEEYVSTPTIKSPFPYRAALQKLKEIKDFGELAPSEAQDLQDYINELARSVSV